MPTDVYAGASVFKHTPRSLPRLLQPRGPLSGASFFPFKVLHCLRLRVLLGLRQYSVRLSLLARSPLRAHTPPAAPRRALPLSGATHVPTPALSSYAAPTCTRVSASTLPASTRTHYVASLPPSTAPPADKPLLGLEDNLRCIRRVPRRCVRRGLQLSSPMTTGSFPTPPYDTLRITRLPSRTRSAVSISRLALRARLG
ncbi:hypothetical protein B0H14DRAFT_1308125 [Mycena olivaceomarginata]|nr:hypothetical protein B0H14DRAFT_1308125 [Mycena olivaceomarginata]